MQSFNQLVGRYLRSKREARGFSVLDVALAVGKSSSFIYQLEAGDKRIPGHLIESLSQCLGVDLRGLIGTERSLDLNVGLTGTFLDQLNSCTHVSADEVGRLRSELRLRCGIDLKNERNLRFHSVAEAAALIGVPMSTWFGWESGEYYPNKESMGKLLEAPYYLPLYIAAWWPWPDQLKTEVPGELSYSFIVHKYGYEKLRFSKRATGLKFSPVHRYPMVTEDQIGCDLLETYWLASDSFILGMRDTCESIIGLREDFMIDASHRMPDKHASMFVNFDRSEIDGHFAELTEWTHQELRLMLNSCDEIMATRVRSRELTRQYLLTLPIEQLTETVDRIKLIDPQASHEALESLGENLLNEPSLNHEAINELIGGDFTDLLIFLEELIGPS